MDKAEATPGSSFPGYWDVTGHSSLAYLRQLPADIVKIDRAFVAGMTSSESTAALTHTLVQLGRTLGLDAVGEGIEQWDQLEQLQREQCELGQGFLLARPAAPEVIGELLSSKQPLRRRQRAPGRLTRQGNWPCLDPFADARRTPTTKRRLPVSPQDSNASVPPVVRGANSDE